MDLPEGVRRERIEPLWERVDSNRVKFVLFIGAYLVSIAASAAFFTAIGAAFVGLFLLRSPSTLAAYYADLGRVVVFAVGVSLVAGSAWVAYALTRSEKRLLGHLGAILTPTGQYITSKLALKDMSLAAGFDHAPSLYVIPDCDRLNAFAIGRTHRTAVIGITQGLADRLTADEQRAVFANLMARLTNGDVRWATAVSALVGPIWLMRENDLRRQEHGELLDSQEAPASDDSMGLASLVLGPTGNGRSRDATGALLYIVLAAFVIVVTEVLMAGHQRSTMLTAEKADAEGMLLLKDPHDMLAALSRVLEGNNTVPSAGEAHSALFYCWAGFGYAPEDDPEFQRVVRLREVLGVEGLVDPPRVPMPARPKDLLEPPAPRLEVTRKELP
jgi:Zn-dependent protease with chaperone function